MADDLQLEIAGDARSTLEQWKDRFKQDFKYYVGVDVGGTNTRVALDTHCTGTPYIQVAKFKASSAKHIIVSLEQLAKQIADMLGQPAAGACLAGAGRTSEDGLSLNVTNYPGSAEDRTLHVSQLPSFLFPADHTQFINDLESTCYGLKSLNEENNLASFFKPLWSASGKVEMRPTTYLVLAVGTGLGVAQLVTLGTGSRRCPLQVMPMEFGHVTYSPSLAPGIRDEEERLMDYLAKEIYNGKHSIEYEDVVSGRGLVAVYKFLTKEHKEVAVLESAEQIGAAAFCEQACPYATKALLIHYRLLMRLAKNLCIGLQAKGMFLAGDNQLANNPFFEKHLDELRKEFLDHPKPDWIDQVELFTQTQSFNINLHGALYYACNEK